MKSFFVQINILLGLMLFSGLLAQAQIIPEALSLIAAPSSPSSGETVTVQAATPTFDKNTAFFDWVVDGKGRPELSGMGQDQIRLTAGSLGSTLRISVTVLRDNSPAGSAAITLSVSDLSLSWFAETYTPSWYKGKALPVQNSVVDMAAIPSFLVNGRTLAREDLIYRWRLDEEDEVSGVGKDTFRIKTSNLPRASSRIRLIVEDTGKQITKEKELFIVPSIPKTVIYSSSPLGGIEPRSAPQIISTAKRGLFDFWAEPFFFNSLSRKSLSYNWTLGTNAISGATENPYLLTVDTGKSQQGNLPISVVVDDRDELIPAASRFLNLFLQ